MSLLTPRELEVAKLLAIGYTSRRVAEALGCSVKTVDTHRLHVLHKLGLAGTVALAREALRRGWVTLDAWACESKVWADDPESIDNNVGGDM